MITSLHTHHLTCRWDLEHLLLILRLFLRILDKVILEMCELMKNHSLKTTTTIMQKIRFIRVLRWVQKTTCWRYLRWSRSRTARKLPSIPVRRLTKEFNNREIRAGRAVAASSAAGRGSPPSAGKLIIASGFLCHQEHICFVRECQPATAALAESIARVCAPA